MQRITAVIHQDLKGKTTILESAPPDGDFDKCVEAFKACDKPGEVVYIRKGNFHGARTIKPDTQETSKNK